MSLQDIHDLYSVPHIKSLEIDVSDGSHLNNRDLVTEKAELTDSLNSNYEIIYGSCESACLKLQVATADKEYKGLWLDVWATIQENSGDLMIDDSHYLLLSDGSKLRMHPYLHSGRIGRFKVVLDEPVADRSWRNLTCYDAMYDILKAEVYSWYKTVEFPKTIKQIRDSFFEYLGIEQENVNLINDNLSIKGEFSASEKLTGRTIIKAICELNGVFGHINAEGKFTYVSIPSEESVTYPYYRDGTGTYERDLVEPVTGIIARDAEDDAGTVVGTFGNPYVITGNPFVFGIEGTTAFKNALNALLAKISVVTYRPFTVASYGNPMLPVGTSIVLNTKNMTINSFIMTRRLTGIQALRDDISAKGLKERLNQTTDLQQEFVQTGGRIHTLEVDLDSLESTIYGEGGVVSTIEQLSNEIVLKVDNNGKIVNVELSAEPTGSAFKIVADNIDFISNGVMNLTAKNIGIQATNFSIDKTTGLMNCQGGSIAGWTISTGKIYGGDSSSGVAVMQKPSSNTTWVFAAGGTSHDAYGNCPFKVSKNGSIFAKYVNITGGSSTATANSVYLGVDDSSPNYARLLFYDSSGSNSAAILSNGQITGKTLSISGSKSRIVQTTDYGKRLLYCYETPTPMFGDVGEGKIAEDGKCYIWTDAEFAQTIAHGTYQVFLQKYGQGECYVTERKSNYFIVEGTAGLSFGWEIKARQAGFENFRLESEREEPEIFTYNFSSFELKEPDYGEITLEHMKSIGDEREVA